MRINLLIITAIAIIAVTFSSRGQAEGFSVVPTEGNLSVRDLHHLGTTLGIDSLLYDYEVPEFHCLHFWLQVEKESGDTTVVDGRGLCSGSGPHRLTIHLSRLEQGHLKPYFFVDDLENLNSSGVGAPKIELADNSGMSQTTVSPSFVFGERTAVADVGYFWTEKDEETGKRVVSSWTRVVILVELRKNPHQILGTE